MVSYQNTENIEEAELVDFARNNAVKEINIVQITSKKYRVVVTLTWKPGAFLLVSYRKKPREWASLDTLIRYLRETYKSPAVPIQLSLMPFDEDPKNTLT